jgi:SPP1 family predicted phage head-tail adaptor
MRAGTLRHPVTIEQDANTASGSLVGEVNPTADSTFLDWRCSITPLEGTELLAAQQRYGAVTHRLKGRYRAGITPQMRVVFNGRVFRIAAALNVDERNRELEMIAAEVVAGQ